MKLTLLEETSTKSRPETSLLLIERLLLESLSRGAKTLFEISDDLKIKERYLCNVLTHLKQKNLVTLSQTHWSLKRGPDLNNFREVASASMSPVEVEEILEAIALKKDLSGVTFKLRKLYLNNEDLAYLDQLFKRIEDFLNYTERRHQEERSCKKIWEESVVIWAQQKCDSFFKADAS